MRLCRDFENILAATRLKHEQVGAKFDQIRRMIIENNFIFGKIIGFTQQLTAMQKGVTNKSKDDVSNLGNSKERSMDAAS